LTDKSRKTLSVNVNYDITSTEFNVRKTGGYIYELIAIKNYELLNYLNRLLTTAEPNIESDEQKNIDNEIERIRKEHGCEVIVNGIISSLKYYLRLLSNPESFVERYTENLKTEFSRSTEIKTEHIEKWAELLRI